MVALQMLLVAGVLGAQPEAVLLNFTQENCSHCRAMEPVVAEIEAGGMSVKTLDVAQFPDVAQRFKLKGTPTFIMTVDGRETGRLVGVASAAQLQALHPQSSIGDALRGQSPEPESYVNDSLVGMFGKGAARRSSASSNTAAPPARDPFTQRQVSAANVRNVAHEEPADDQADPQARAMAATVRLKVEEPQGQAIGTGTIIDTHDDEAVLVTCAHIFRASKGQGRIQVELFQPQPQTVEGKLLDYDLTRDIAVVSIRCSAGAVSAPVAPTGVTVNKQDPAFSVGCDKGADPTIRQTKITNLNRYVGPPNIEAHGEPTIGRSGGGLFNREGYLIGVCNCADAQDNEGIYAATASIHWQLDKVGLAELFQPQANLAASNQPTAVAAATFEEPAAREASPRSAAVSVPASPEDTEIIAIVRSRSNPSAKGQVIVIPRASQLLLQQIAADSGDPTTAADLALTADRRSAAAPIREPGPIVRGQSRQ
jgi:S1-C subfamily serine protease